jgi:hypothetical protein
VLLSLDAFRYFSRAKAEFEQQEVEMLTFWQAALRNPDTCTQFSRTIGLSRAHIYWILNHAVSCRPYLQRSQHLFREGCTNHVRFCEWFQTRLKCYPTFHSITNTGILFRFNVGTTDALSIIEFIGFCFNCFSRNRGPGLRFVRART